MRRLWLLALVASLGLAIWMAAVDADDALPRHFGWYLAAACLLAGLLFGMRGVVLPAVAIAVLTIVSLATRNPPPPPAEDQTALAVVYGFLILPAMFGAIAAVGALIRFVVNLLRRL